MIGRCENPKDVKECDLDRLRAVVTFDIRVASTPKARVAA